jgi:murein L,D-transpeptidase YcbB/YkuD
MRRERGRGAVLVGVARVDAALESLLKAALLPPSARESLFQTDRPLGSFGARIALARRLGLIESEVEHSLQALRKVRNDFAHSTSDIALGEPAQQGRLAESYRQARSNPLWEALEQLVQQQQGPRAVQNPGLVDFILLITILVAFLEAMAQQIKPVQPFLVMGFEGISQNPPEN